jgi:ornithine cyclodeaminase/alanine dehydrogenase-like protein (mu-crystallin family)
MNCRGQDNNLMLYLTESDVIRFLTMKDCIRLMQSAFERLASGEALNQPRRRLVLRSKAALHYMAGSDGKYFGAKIYSTHPVTGAHFLFLLYRADDAEPLALIEANHLGRIRTGAASGFATRLLARPGTTTVGVIGSGFQARTQLEAVLNVLPIEGVRVWSRSAEKRDAFASECRSAFVLPVSATETAEEAVRGADVLITATNSATPVVESSWVGPGVHINAMGSNQALRRELPEDLVRRCDLIVADSVEQAQIESGDLLMALRNEEWTRVRELPEVVSGYAGRTSPEELTLFKSNGLAVEDVVAAGYIYELAKAAGVGRQAYS